MSEEPKEKEYRMKIKEEDRKLIVGALCDKVERFLRKAKDEKDITPLMNVLFRFTNIDKGAPNRFYHWWSDDYKKDVMDELKRIKEREKLL